MRDIRRKEKAVDDQGEQRRILEQAQYITIAMCQQNEPYLVTLSHGYDKEKNILYFHCASEGKKIDILRKNNIVWGQALLDQGYVQGKCSHLWAMVMFRGIVTFITDADEKRHALETMIKHLEDHPEPVMKKQITKKSLNQITIGRIAIEYMSGKQQIKP